MRFCPVWSCLVFCARALSCLVLPCLVVPCFPLRSTWINWWRHSLREIEAKLICLEGDTYLLENGFIPLNATESRQTNYGTPLRTSFYSSAPTRCAVRECPSYLRCVVLCCAVDWYILIGPVVLTLRKRAKSSEEALVLRPAMSNLETLEDPRTSRRLAAQRSARRINCFQPDRATNKF